MFRCFPTIYHSSVNSLTLSCGIVLYTAWICHYWLICKWIEFNYLVIQQSFFLYCFHLIPIIRSVSGVKLFYHVLEGNLNFLGRFYRPECSQRRKHDYLVPFARNGGYAHLIQIGVRAKRRVPAVSECRWTYSRCLDSPVSAFYVILWLWSRTEHPVDYQHSRNSITMLMAASVKGIQEWWPHYWNVEPILELDVKFAPGKYLSAADWAMTMDMLRFRVIESSGKRWGTTDLYSSFPPTFLCMHWTCIWTNGLAICTLARVMFCPGIRIYHHLLFYTCSSHLMHAKDVFHTPAVTNGNRVHIYVCDTKIIESTCTCEIKRHLQCT
jgi:hypothetical protein